VSPDLEIPQLDLKACHRPLREQLLSAIARVVDSSAFILGENVRRFEQEFASFLGARFGVGVASCTDALKLSLIALGIGKGDEVLLPSFTYAATAAAVRHLRATPVFVDSEPGGYNLDLDQLEARITPRTRAIVPVHLFGECVDMARVMEIARAHNLKVIEDVAQALGARRDGRAAGTFGDAGCFSFYPTKNLGGFGDGGMVVTEEEETAERVRLLRHQADESVRGGAKYHHEMLGYNSRLDEIQAAVLRVKLPFLEQWNERRIALAARYLDLLGESGLGLPHSPEGSSHVYYLFVVTSPHRDRLQRHLQKRRIQSLVYYPRPLHLQGAHRDLGYRAGGLPNCERLSREALSLPLYPELTDEQADRVAEAVITFAARSSSRRKS
jgi:dTDP-4-amino-4,6-dideoxygalactose transaminase